MKTKIGKIIALFGLLLCLIIMLIAGYTANIILGMFFTGLSIIVIGILIMTDDLSKR